MDTQNKYYQMMLDEIKTITDRDIMVFASQLLDRVPDYFFSVPASSSGKYHPKNDLGEGGLVRHSISVKRMLDHLLTPEGYWNFTDKEKDLLRVAALFHDCLKSGTQEEYEKCQHTSFYHPLYSTTFITGMSVNLSFPYEDARFIADAIISHMGQWNTSNYAEGTLPKPKTDAQKILHLADYLSSRKDINMEFETEEKEPEDLTGVIYDRQQ